MVKQTWKISDKERNRILNLHESATKKLYLFNEQDTKIEGKTWQLCSTQITQVGDRFFAQIGEPSPIEIPKLSEVYGTIQGRNFVLDQLTQNGLKVGKWMNNQESCSQNFPSQYKGVSEYNWFCYFDDVSSKLIKNAEGKESYMKDNVPKYGLLSWDGTLRTSMNDFTPEEIQKDKNGVKVQFNVNRSKSFVLEVSPAMVGSEVTEKEPEKEIVRDEPEMQEFNYESPFVFAKTDLTPEAEIQFKKFIDTIKSKYQGVKGNVEVITSASIDAEPSSKERYNMELSTKRANKIIERLKNETGNTSLMFIPKPLGQTDRFAPGMRFPNADTEQTSPNRRLIIKLPKIYR